MKYVSPTGSQLSDNELIDVLETAEALLQEGHPVVVHECKGESGSKTVIGIPNVTERTIIVWVGDTIILADRYEIEPKRVMVLDYLFGAPPQLTILSASRYNVDDAYHEVEDEAKVTQLKPEM